MYVSYLNPFVSTVILLYKQCFIGNIIETNVIGCGVFIELHVVVKLERITYVHIGLVCKLRGSKLQTYLILLV